MQRKENIPIIEKHFTMQRKDMALFQFILEGYEGVAVVTAVDSPAACVRVSTTPYFAADVDKIINAVRKEFSFAGFASLPEEYFNVRETL